MVRYTIRGSKEYLVKKMAKILSPCIDICKFKRQGHCIGCSMTKAQKSTFKALKEKKPRAEFINTLREQQNRLGGYEAWPQAYRRQCLKKGSQDLLEPLPQLASP